MKLFEPLIIDETEIEHPGFRKCIECRHPAVGQDTDSGEDRCFYHYLEVMEGDEPFENEWVWFTVAMPAVTETQADEELVDSEL